MASTPGESDERIEELLNGDADAIEEGIGEADRAYRYKISGLLRHRFPGLPDVSLPEIWQETLISLYWLAKTGRVEQNGKISGLLFTIAHRRAKDQMRREATRRRRIPPKPGDLDETAVLKKWSHLDSIERSEVLEEIVSATRQMPPRQKAVLEVFAEYYPATESLAFLVDQVRKVATGRDGRALTPKAVASALNAGRLKIQKALRKRGYEP